MSDKKNEDKNNPVAKNTPLSSKPSKANSADEQSGKAKFKHSAADKIPSTEATLDLMELLGTMGDAGLELTLALSQASSKVDFDEEPPEQAQDEDLTEEPEVSEVPPPPEAAEVPKLTEVPVISEIPDIPEIPQVLETIQEQNDSKEATEAELPEKQSSAPGASVATSKQEAATPDYSAAATETHQKKDPLTRLANLSRTIPDANLRELFQTTAAQALNEIKSGKLGQSTLLLFDIVCQFGSPQQLKQEYLEIAGNSNSLLEVMTPPNSTNEIHFRIMGPPPAQDRQILIIKAVPDTGARLKADTILTDRLDLDPLTSRLYENDIDEYTGKAISTSARAQKSGVEVSPAFKPEALATIRASLPVEGTPLANFVRSSGLSGDALNSYFQSVFYKTNSPSLRQQVLQGLRDEVRSRTNTRALPVLQELSIIKAAIELCEAEKTNNETQAGQSLIQLAALEDVSTEAALVLHKFDADTSLNSEDISSADRAREGARELARKTFTAASHAYESFLSRELDNLPAPERHQKRLEFISQIDLSTEQRLYSMARDDFGYLSDTLKSMDTLLTITETDDPPAGAEELGKLIQMQMQGENQSALDYLTHIHNALQKESLAPGLEQVHADLLGTERQSRQALQLLQACLPDVKAERDECLLHQIVKDLGSASSYADMKEAGKILEKEKNYGNKSASILLKWTKTGESTARITEVIKTRNLKDLASVKTTAETIKIEMEKLAQLALQTNDYARTTLTGMLMTSTDQESQLLFCAAQEKEALIPDLAQLSITERSILQEHAALLLAESLKKSPNINPLTVSCATGMAVALSETYASGDRNVQKALEEAFDIALKCLSRTNALDGLLEAITRNLPGSGKLSELILTAISGTDGLNSTQRRRLAVAARQGVPGAIRTLAAACASDCPSAPLAAADLVKAGASASNRDQVLSIMLDQYQRSSDRHSLLAAMGDIASRDNPARQAVMETIRQAIESASNKPDSQEYKSAQKGLLFLAENWGAREINILRHNLKMEILAALPSIAEKLSPGTRELLLKLEHELLLAGNPEERLAAVQALAAFGRYAEAEVVFDIGFFITPQGKTELERAGLSKDKTSLFIDFAARALVSFMTSADPEVQEAAFDAFRKQGNWPGLLGDQSIRHTIIDYAQGRSTELELNKDAMHLVYEAGLARPLFATFRDLGAGGEKTSTQQLLQQAARAASNYARPTMDGKAVVHRVLTNAVILNALSPGLREKITGAKYGTDMSQLAGQLINGTIDAQHPPENPLFCDLTKRLLQEQRLLESRASQLQSSLPEPDLPGSESLPEANDGKKIQRIGTGKCFVDPFMFADKLSPANHPGYASKETRTCTSTINIHLVRAKTDLSFINLAQQCGRQFWLTGKNQKAADRLLMFMLAQHGAQLLCRFAPTIFQQVPQALLRLHENNLAVTDRLPVFNQGACKKALSILPGIQRAAGISEAADYRALLKITFEQIDSLPVFGKFQTGAAEIVARLPVLQTIFAKAVRAPGSQELFEKAQKHAREIQKALAEIEPDDLMAAKDLTCEMKRILTRLKDQETARLMQQRLKAYEGALELFGGKTQAPLRQAVSEVLMRDTSETALLCHLFARLGPALNSGLDQAEAILSLSFAAPLSVSGIVAAPCASLTASELTREGRQWLELGPEDRLVGELCRGFDYYDEKLRRNLKLALPEIAGSYIMQQARDLSLALVCTGTAKNLAPALAQIGQDKFADLLEKRGAAFGGLALGFQKAEAIASCGQDRGFVEDYFGKLSLESTFTAKQDKSAEIVGALLDGEYDKTAPLLGSLARCLSSGIGYVQKTKFVEFYLKADDLWRAPELLNMQLAQLYNDGYTLRIKGGARFEAIDACARVTEFRPAADVSAHLQDYIAPAWLAESRTRAVIEDMQLGALDESLPVVSTRTDHADDLTPAYMQPPVRPVNKLAFAIIERYMSEISDSSAAEFKRLVKDRQKDWKEDLFRSRRLLRQIEPELQDGAGLLTRLKEQYCADHRLHDMAEQELSHQKGWLNKPLSERLVGIEQKVIDKVEQLEQNPEHPLGRARQDYEKLRREHDFLKLSLEKQTEERKLELQKVLDYMHAEHAWTSVLLVVRQDRAEATDNYLFGSGKICLPCESLYAAGNLDQLIFHDMAHSIQDRQLGEYSLSKTAAQPPQARLVYQNLTGRQTSEEFMTRTAERRKQIYFSRADETRLLELAENLQTARADLCLESEKLYMRLGFMEGRLYSLTRDKSGQALSCLFHEFQAETTGIEFQRRLFKNSLPPPVQEIFDQWRQNPQQYANGRQEKAKQIIIEALQDELEQSRHEYALFRRTSYSYDRLEQEAYAAASQEHYGLIASPPASPGVKGVTPQEARQILLSASGKKGDTLHPENRGAESTRRLYETRLLQGIMSPAQTRQLLNLPPPDRLALETLLKNERRPYSKFVLAKILALESKTLHNLLSVPPTVANNLFLPGLDCGLISAKALDQILDQSDQQRRLSMDFVQKIMKDHEHVFCAEHVERFLALPPNGRIDIARALTRSDLSRALSVNEAALALSAPTRQVCGKEFCDAAVLVKALQKSILSSEQVNDFARLDEDARSGLSALLGTNALTRETATIIMQKLRKNELPGLAVKDLGTARLVGWLPDGALEQVLALEASFAYALFDCLATEIPRGKAGAFSVSEFIKRQSPVNDMRKQGIINEPTMRQLSTQHESDLIVLDILHKQSARKHFERIAAESIQQLILLARTSQISMETLEAYRLGIESGWLDYARLKSLLCQPPETRQALETCLQFDPLTFIQLARDGRYDVLVNEAAELVHPAHTVFPDMFPPDGKFVFSPPPGLENFLDASKVISHFMAQINLADHAGAINTVLASDIFAAREIRFIETNKALFDLNYTAVLESIAGTLASQIRLRQERQDGDLCRADNMITCSDLLIEIAGRLKFRLRDSEQIFEDGQWRQSSLPEKAFIENIQNSDTGRAILGTTALQLISVWTKLTAREKLRSYILNESDETSAEKDSSADDSGDSAAALTSTRRSARELMSDNFAGLSRGYSEITYESGMKAAINMPPEKFKAIEESFNIFMTALARASKHSGDERERRMGELAYYFDMEFTAALEFAGIRLGNATHPYLKLLFEITLADNYRPDGHWQRTPVDTLDLNSEQGLRRYLSEHPQGKRLYLQLASVKKSGITPKFDPSPFSGRPARINAQDTRKLTLQQRSALAQAILQDREGLYERMYLPPLNSCLNALLEMTVYTLGDQVNHTTSAFNRAEEWIYLMVALNDNKPLSQGGRWVRELFAAGAIPEFAGNAAMLINSTDFMQTLLEMDISPEDTLWDAPGHYRLEITQRLVEEHPEAYFGISGSLKNRLRKITRMTIPEPPQRFERGKAVSYAHDLHRLIALDESAENALIMYDGVQRETLPVPVLDLLETELQENYRQVIPGNYIHYASKDKSDRSIYVLTLNSESEPCLHTDNNLHLVGERELQDYTPADAVSPEAEITLSKDLAQKARDMFCNYKEYGLIISGQNKPLPLKQLILGAGNDAGSKVTDRAGRVCDRHLQILVSAKGVAVQDLNSSSGSFLNGSRLDPYDTVYLRTTDRVTLGGTDGPWLALAYKPTEKSKAPEYKYIIGDKILSPGSEPLTVGRLPSADAFVSDPTVSKIQATIRMTADGTVYIKDGGKRPSYSGLAINGEQLPPGNEVELNPLDKVATITGVILPITYEKKRSRFTLLVETGSGRVNIKDASLAGMPVFLGVDPRHGVYALPKNNVRWLLQPTWKYTGGSTFFIKAEARIPAAPQDKVRNLSPGARCRQGPLYASTPMSDPTVNQANEFALTHVLETKIEDGWSSTVKGITFDFEGGFEAQNRIATTVDRRQDPILHGVIEDARRRFWHLSPELRARALTDYARELLTPGYMTPAQLDRWYNQFCHDHDGKRVLLGEFIKEGKGVCSQQAILLKVLADEFDDMSCTLVRGMDGSHLWTTFIFARREIIHDPRGRFISPVAGEPGALPPAIHWIPDTETTLRELSRQAYVKVGDAVSFDGTTGWKVSAYDTLSGEITLSCDGTRYMSSADLALANPGKTLKIGERCSLPRENSELLDRDEAAWTFEDIGSDGTLKFFKAGAIQVQARLDQIKLRAKQD